MRRNIIELQTPSRLPLYHVGPPLDFGPLPSLFYFALSGEDSLGLDPFNQPVVFLQEKMIRVFSLTLPAHEQGLPPTKAIEVWAQEYAKGLDPLGKFFDEALEGVSFAIQERFIDPEKMSIAGLSRGGLIAFHLAALEKRFQKILAFAPITRLSQTKEFRSSSLDRFDAGLLKESLWDRRIRLYIGNRDTRVGTDHCFQFAMDLVEEGVKRGRSSPQIECFISPSIGRDGHGTPPEIFLQGATWIASS